MTPARLPRLPEQVSIVGLLLGAWFFAASLTPTLVPRTFLTQGALSGSCWAAGYAIGLLFRQLWFYLELPRPTPRTNRIATFAAAAISIVAVIVSLWRAAPWQNSIRSVMGLPPETSAHPFRILGIAVATALALMTIGAAFLWLRRVVSARTDRLVPPRVSKVLGIGVAIVVFWSVANGLIFRAALRVMDSSFERLDTLFEPERAQPTSPLKTGSPASLLRWSELGRTGRGFIASGPTAAEIGDFTKKDALDPIRVYVGLRSAETARERARLALEELKRVKAFDRSILIVITPTGTGWVDPSAMNSVEYLHNGDVASVALQYSYLSSPLSLIVEPEYGAEASRALFTEIYAYWTALPRDKRPRFYLHGLSLGSMNSEKSFEMFELIGDPINGALWSGPPFRNRLWRTITDDRNAGSPAWLPQFRDGAFVRFANQNGFSVPTQTPWGPMRIAYLQYASDAITFFDPHDFYREPAWMKSPRGPDVAPELRWYPVVTMLQLGLDMAVATATPLGYGHVYAPAHYIDAWIAVTDVKGWSPEDLARLKQHLTSQWTAPTSSRSSAEDDRGG